MQRQNHSVNDYGLVAQPQPTVKQRPVADFATVRETPKDPGFSSRKRPGTQ